MVEDSEDNNGYVEECDWPVGGDGGAGRGGVHHVHFSDLENGEEQVRGDVLVLRVDA